MGNHNLACTGRHRRGPNRYTNREASIGPRGRATCRRSTRFRRRMRGATVADWIPAAAAGGSSSPTPAGRRPLTPPPSRTNGPHSPISAAVGVLAYVAPHHLSRPQPVRQQFPSTGCSPPSPQRAPPPPPAENGYAELYAYLIQQQSFAVAAAAAASSIFPGPSAPLPPFHYMPTNHVITNGRRRRRCRGHRLAAVPAAGQLLKPTRLRYGKCNL
ncbi:hypothetical protein AGLY_010289 [Aphis glycines]|uniref:Uncharacterized protein n=1 Tax=Aphis glycines TaxID=307491 RepID=A0A6G0TGV9_APHGL|nr:hypothetical protein AGLY_010289 [Aphis glycines]